ncbi:ATP phosphoribosyltransferase regulatory subunit [Wenxinia saemankumensis]|uniref:ATP phosphoribosyltransferase regulatory subunit n=1 Tax=Wenxinia saemankumensis TaxID=1447782 RepID=A0A1M6FHC6_9RHOB|nr:ATP phosphoribosyltransferase regulatory subunit [Wenxinia saemankumensis]SHI97077.1 ATP phosphoribosyltransferase regulatory subunit [Wenxinia saemankumensis]
MIPAGSPAARDEAARCLELFREAGAVPVETTILQPADVLLDLYGEDIRARAFTTTDPIRGEMMLRPDFTVPVAQAHMAAGGDPARYCYAGEVFRRQEIDETRPAEYLQVGFELFGGTDPAGAEAEIFGVLSDALGGLGLRAAIGDMGLIVAAIRGLETTEARKTALLRHVWRPRRFRALLDRFGGRGAIPAGRAALLGLSDPLDGAGPEIGKRGRDEIAARIAALREDAAAPPIPDTARELLDELVAIRAPAPDALSHLRDIAVDLPAIGPAVEAMADRLAALSDRGVDVSALDFEASYGRTALEYYDGFVFGLYAAGRPDLPPIATGGRYDALTRALAGTPAGRAGTPAVGGVIRPDLVAAIREMTR